MQTSKPRKRVEHDWLDVGAAVCLVHGELAYTMPKALADKTPTDAVLNVVKIRNVQRNKK